MREKARQSPQNSRTIDNLDFISRIFSVTKDTGGFVQLYDSKSDDDYTLDGWIIVYATENNLRIASCGLLTGRSHLLLVFLTNFSLLWDPFIGGTTTKRGLLFGFVLLKKKEEIGHNKILKIILSEVGKLNIEIVICPGTWHITDFELAIMNASQKEFGD